MTRNPDTTFSNLGFGAELSFRKKVMEGAHIVDQYVRFCPAYRRARLLFVRRVRPEPRRPLNKRRERGKPAHPNSATVGRAKQVRRVQRLAGQRQSIGSASQTNRAVTNGRMVPNHHHVKGDSRSVYCSPSSSPCNGVKLREKACRWVVENICVKQQRVEIPASPAMVASPASQGSRAAKAATCPANLGGRANPANEGQVKTGQRRMHSGH